MALAIAPSGYQTSDYTARRNYTIGNAPITTVQGGIAVSVQMSPSWDKLIKRYRNFHGSDELKKTGLIKWAMAEGVKVAQSQLDILVYKAPLPPSAANDPNYLDRARTGRTREAIMQRPDFVSGVKGDSGAIVVDKSHFPGFYYPRVLDAGSSTINYRGTHFWNNTRAIMRPKFAARGREARHQLRMSLKVM